jgi:putative inorganic carbon (hco3(-)) transporter
VASKEVRVALLKARASLTPEHPLFGVGPGEFSDVMTGKAAAKGLRNASQVAHNAYTQLSCEAGIPALIFLIAAIVSTYRLLARTEKLARSSPAHREMGIAAFYVIVALVAFSTCICFLSLIYRFYLPALSGMAIALAEAARREITTPKPV